MNGGVILCSSGTGFSVVRGVIIDRAVKCSSNTEGNWLKLMQFKRATSQLQRQDIEDEVQS